MHNISYQLTNLETVNVRIPEGTASKKVVEYSTGETELKDCTKSSKDINGEAIRIRPVQIGITELKTINLVEVKTPNPTYYTIQIQ